MYRAFLLQSPVSVINVKVEFFVYKTIRETEVQFTARLMTETNTLLIFYIEIKSYAVLWKQNITADIPMPENKVIRKVNRGGSFPLQKSAVLQVSIRLFCSAFYI